MSETTDRFEIPLIMPSQAQKHVTHNEAITLLDIITHNAIDAHDVTDLPADPTIGYCVEISETPVALISAHAGQLATMTAAGWRFFTPIVGMVAFSKPETKLVLRTEAGSWKTVADIDDLARQDIFGVNTDADATNKLAVKSKAVLFSALESEVDGGDDCRVVINRSDDASTASLVFQSEYEGRAEIGLVGDDRLSVKTSGGQDQWVDALAINASSGEVDMPQTPLSRNLLFNILKDGGRFAGTPEPVSITASSFQAPNYLSAYNGAVFAAAGKFTHNNSTFGGTGAALDTDIEALIEKLRDVDVTSSFGRYGVEFYALEITAGSGTTAQVAGVAVPHYLAALNRTAPLWAKSTFSYNLLVKSGSAVVAMSSDTDLIVDSIKQDNHLEVAPIDGWRQIVRRFDYDPRQFYSYDTSMLRLYMTPGAQCLIALPFLFPGQVTVGQQPFGVISSLESWR